MPNYESPLEVRDQPLKEVSFESLLESRDIEQIASAIYTLDPQSAIDVFRYDSRLSQEFHDSEERERPEWLTRFEDATDKVIENITASGDLEWAREISVTVAQSPDPDERIWAGFMVPDLTRADRETGMLHWDHLLRDQDDSVRQVAHLPLETFSTPFVTPEELEAACAEYGISVDDGWGLEAAFQQAEGGTDIYDPPAEAALKLGELLLRQDQ